MLNTIYDMMYGKTDKMDILKCINTHILFFNIIIQ